ncbi:hypothetical protein ATR01nite_05700 [Acetobacter tropicalis]|uniref:Uncharacterized protein n=1 Tax=Acetobacter tropicalis TaxID=104102 RepID=A0A511FJT5_9PROT|nr:hypothetical protein ATR01nite_05700 [Acetobacter tropicalis]
MAYDSPIGAAPSASALASWQEALHSEMLSGTVLFVRTKQDRADQFGDHDEFHHDRYLFFR